METASGSATAMTMPARSAPQVLERAGRRACPSSRPLSGRRQIGGVVGFEVSASALDRFAHRLGGMMNVLYMPHGDRRATTRTFVCEWDCCFVDDVRIDGERMWESLLAAGRLADIEGAFAVAWLSPDGTVHLARDAVGERSLYYAVVDGGLVFASTVPALLAVPHAPRSLSTASVATYLTFAYVPGRESLVEGIYELLPGERLSFREGRAKSERFWSLPPEKGEAGAEDDYTRRLRALLERAVARRLPPSGPVAAALSGGVDSSLVVALASALYGGAIASYSISFGPTYPNELAFSSLVSARCGTRQHVVEITPRTVMDRFDETLAALSCPIGEPLTVPNALLFEEASAASATVLNGEGGDPCFGGPKNLPMILHEAYGSGKNGGADRWHRERAYLLAHRKCYDELHAMLADGVAPGAADRLAELVTDHLSDGRWSTLVNRLMALNVSFKGAHHILAKVDHLSRLHGVFPRSPLFDRGVVEAAAAMPASLKLRGAVEKHILKQAVADLVPPEILQRPKSGMRVPVEGWVQQGQFFRFARERILDGLSPYGVFRRSYVEALVHRDPRRRPRRAGAKIWLLLSLEAWLRTVLAARDKR
jgi:asparagine synthase (glutamine-hydrolysing)